MSTPETPPFDQPPAVPLARLVLPPDQAPTFDLRAELIPAGETARVAPDVPTPLPEAREPTQLPDAADQTPEQILGPRPDPGTVKVDAAGLHRRTKPAQTVAEANTKAKAKGLEGIGNTGLVSEADALKLVDGETERVLARYNERLVKLKDVPTGINPITDPDLERFVRAHLSYINMFYVVTGQPPQELIMGRNAEDLQKINEGLTTGLDPALKGMKAAQLAVQMGWNPDDDTGDRG